MRAVANVAIGKQYAANQSRLGSILVSQGEMFVGWQSLPSNSPSHADTAYAFKAFALAELASRGFTTLLWADSSIVPIRPLAPLWDLIESQGYWFSVNLPYGKTGALWMTGQWMCDEALTAFDPISEDLFEIPHVIATAFGIDLRHEIGRRFLAQYLAAAKDGRAFRGPWTNERKQASSDPRVLGHRHDQTVASVIAWRLGMKLTTPPAWIVDGLPATPETILEIHR